MEIALIIFRVALWFTHLFFFCYLVWLIGNLEEPIRSQSTRSRPPRPGGYRDQEMGRAALSGYQTVWANKLCSLSLSIPNRNKRIGERIPLPPSASLHLSFAVFNQHERGRRRRRFRQSRGRWRRRGWRPRERRRWRCFPSSRSRSGDDKRRAVRISISPLPKFLCWSSIFVHGLRYGCLSFHEAQRKRKRSWNCWLKYMQWFCQGLYWN